MELEIVRLGGAWHYRLEEKLACSTFGEVWRALWMQTGKMVALKRLNRALGVNLTAEMELLRHESLQRELAVYQRLGENFHFARLMHHGEVDRVPIMILELLDGDIDALMRAKMKPVEPGDALEWLRQAASGLAWMHAHGLCHLDLKPQNLLFSRRNGSMPPVLKIADFGLALDCSSGAVPHRIPGTPGWMAPEQLMQWLEDGGEGNVYRCDARADVYALGLLLFYFLTGHRTSFSAELAEGMRSGDPDILKHLVEHTKKEGLSTLDCERLRVALSSERVTNCRTDQPMLQGGATWLPNVIKGRESWNNSFHASLHRLLIRMLSFDVCCRPQNAGLLLRELERGL